jgi:hypothetical protein
MNTYTAPEGTEAKTIVVERNGGFCLYSVSLGHTYGIRRKTWEEAKEGADRENIRMAQYTVKTN